MSDDREVNVRVVGDADSDAKHRLQYRRLRAPAGSGESLQIPPLVQTAAQWKPNDADSIANVQVGDFDMTTLRRRGRAELLRLATEYTRQYMDVDLSDRDQESIVMSGHQPQLFHPGVWFKNFALSSLAEKVNAMPVNLVVDNDICGPAAIRCPVFKDGKASTSLIRFDEAHPSVPFETRPIVENKIFETFPDRASEELKACFARFQKHSKPLVSDLWPHVRATRQSMGASASLGTVLAAGRHRLEKDAGLETLEIPISRVAETETFARFASSIVSQQERFNRSYNVRLLEYRELHKIRSTAHPVPELRTVDGWMEAPFWIWTVENPVRRPLFVRPFSNEIELSDLEGWKFHAASKSLAEAWRSLSETGISLRPRALITTMFCRLIMSDRFLHGIGGAKYDQLTDAIARDFCVVKPPPFSTLTATFRLPLGYPQVDQSNQSALRQQIRQLRFHPEKYIEPSQPADELIARKQAAVDDAQMNRLDRHREIERANRLLQPCVAEHVESLTEELNQVSADLQNSRILNSREFSFCLFDESLIDDLKRLSDVNR